MPIRRIFIVALILFAVACGEGGLRTAGQALDADDPCAGVKCAGSGACYADDGQAFCLCGPDHHAAGLHCLPLAGGRPAPGSRSGSLIVSIAEAEDGRGPDEVGQDLTEYPYDLGRYLGPDEAWCSEFVSWVYRVAEDPFTGGYEGGWMLKGSTGIRSWFQNHAQWVGSDGPDWDAFEPSPGDYMRLDTAGGGHSAIVRYVSGTTLYTAEGNVSNRVRLRSYNNYKNYSSIDGFGHRTSENAPPTVDAGPDASIVLPDAATLAGSVGDDGLPDDTLTTAWSQVSGPGTASFANAASPATTVIFPEAGTYLLRLAADDGALQASDEVTVEALENHAPTVDAGPDHTVVLPDPAGLAGAVEDDGLPDDDLVTAWSQIDGPGIVSFGNASLPATTATFSAQGTYLLRLTADDGRLQASDEVSVEVLENQPPTVSAGPDQVIALPDSAELHGTAGDDGLPDDTLITAWTQIDGPGAVSFADAASPATAASFPQPGSYVLRLTADDGRLQASDDLTVEARENLGPSVDAGPDRTVTFPEVATLAATVDDDGLPDGTLTLTWSQVSGPGRASFGDATSTTAEVAFSEPGGYVLRLAADDGRLQAQDELTVTVEPPGPIQGSCGCGGPGRPGAQGSPPPDGFALVWVLLLFLLPRFRKPSKSIW